MQNCILTKINNEHFPSTHKNRVIERIKPIKHIQPIEKREVIDKITKRNVTHTDQVTLSIDSPNVNRQKYQAIISPRKVNYFDNERSIKTSKLEHNAGERHGYLFHWPSRLVYVS